MWRDTASASELREAYPEIALSLETEDLVMGLVELGVRCIRRSRKNSPVLEIAMQDSCFLRVSPVDKGNRGVAEWVTWSWQGSDEDETKQVLNSSFRAYVELVSTTGQGKEVLTSFTTHCEDATALIENAIYGIRYRTGKSYKPISTRRRAA